MKKCLQEVHKIWHYEGGLYRSGAPVGLRGDTSRLYGDVSGLSGDATGVFGTATGYVGDLDDCLITDEERKAGVYIQDLVPRV